MKVWKVMSSSVAKCPYLILEAQHYRADGSCRCDDPLHTVMLEWEYSWDEATARWRGCSEQGQLLET